MQLRFVLGGLILVLLVTAVIVIHRIMPEQLFFDQYSVIIEDREGELLGARIAPDGQWRFPASDYYLSPRYKAAVVTFEDRRFYYHPGIDALAILRALKLNVQQRRVVSGGSTLTMQLVSLARHHKSTNVFDKVWEMVLAVAIDAFYTKEEIFRLYADHAPFGGNTVGYQAALWRYFGKHHKELTWSEAALLAVLPNDPALIHLSRNRSALLNKRNALLESLARRGFFAVDDLSLFKDEPLPGSPHRLPEKAPQLLTSLRKLMPAAGNYIHSSLDGDLQVRVTELLQREGAKLKANEVHNAAILVASVQTGQVLAYAGNIPGTGAIHGEQVDIITAPRSSGSVLKPFLSMWAIQEGMKTRSSLMPDVPINIDGFRPDNFTYDYEGAAPLSRALQKSLNIPFVLLLREYNIARFLTRLRKTGFNTLTFPADHYGLSLIIGGGEVSLWDLCGAYASAARTLNHFNRANSRYFEGDIHDLTIDIEAEKSLSKPEASAGLYDAAAIWQVFDILADNTRPHENEAWEDVGSGEKIAWKTGTSIGFRDAWCVGVNSDYVVGVWIGNADGEGRPGVIGLETAAPLLFNTFRLLPAGHWFDQPFDAMQRSLICKNSGYAPTPYCPMDTVWTVKNISSLPVCTFDQQIHLDVSGRYRVNGDCYDPFGMFSRNYFVLPPTQQYYYEQKHSVYTHLPPWLPACRGNGGSNAISLIYPLNVTKIFLPKNQTSTLNPVVLRAAHTDPKATIYWHLDNTFIGETHGTHALTSLIPEGHHTLTCMDGDGNRVSAVFDVVHSK